MLLADLNQKTLTSVEPVSLKVAGLLERQHVQDLFCRNPGAFCEELGEYIHLVGCEIQPTEVVQDRIDILGVDPEGSAVIIEIKRSSHKLHLLQAIAYAAMVSKWDPGRFVERLSLYNQKYLNKDQTVGEAEEELSGILEDGDIASVNKHQRIVLIAEEFDYEALVAAEWLTESYYLDIRCYRINLARHEGHSFLTCSRTYPPPEITEVAKIRRRRIETGLNEPSDWTGVFASIKNDALIRYFDSALKRGAQNNPARSVIRFRDQEGIRFRVSAKKDFASVIQNGRFDNDEKYWKKHLSANCDFRTRNEGSHAAFRLITEADFSQFDKAISEHRGSEFCGATSSPDLEFQNE